MVDLGPLGVKGSRCHPRHPMPPAVNPLEPQNTLYYRDNLDVLRRYVADESVDLVYLDPPFNSNQD